MPTWEEIFTSSNPAGGRMINVISGVAGSEASPYTADNPSGGRAINVNIVSGGAGAGVLQLQNNAPLDTTLRSVTDQANTVSPLQLSTTSVNVTSIFYVDQDIQWNNNLGYGLKSANGTRVLSITNTLMSSSTTPLSLGTSTNSARLHVRGDGTNPITRFEATDGVLFWSLNSTATIQRMGGTTNAFPAIKRNGAAIDFRLADDSGYCNISCSTLVALAGVNSYSNIEGFSTGQSGSFSGSVRVGSGGSNAASAILDVVSTTKGFLPPRMTTVQKNAIGSPAEGLVVMDTTLHKLCVYSGSAWEVITSV